MDTGNLVKGTLVSSEFWKMIGGKMLEESNARVHTAERGGKGLRVLGKGERIKFYLVWSGLQSCKFVSLSTAIFDT